jgi:putative endopeptidase
MRRCAIGLVLLAFLLAGNITTWLPAEAAIAQPAVKPWGLSLDAIDRSVRPGDDFFLYGNGRAVARITIPPDRRSVSVLGRLEDRVDKQLRAIVTENAANPTAIPGSEAQKIGDWYTSAMDTDRIEALGTAPLQPALARIAAINSHAALSSYLGANNGRLGSSPLLLYVEQAADNPRLAELQISPDTVQTILSGDDAKDPAKRAAALAHVSRMLALAGFDRTDQRAANVLRLEAAILALKRLPTTDINVTRNRIALADLPARYPGIDWTAALAGGGITSTKPVNVDDAPGVKALAALVAAEPVAAWQDFFAYHLVRDDAPNLPRAFREARFDWYDRTLGGMPAPEPRDKTVLEAMKYSLTYAISKLWVERYCDPETKTAAIRMVGDFAKAFDARIARSDWMAPETKAAARRKLAMTKGLIGWPDVWPSYAGLAVVRGDALGNAERSLAFKRADELALLDKPFDQGRWITNFAPIFVGATAAAPTNQIIVPAAILQSPAFDPAADPAVNYGGIGIIIAHELTHLFDPIGAQFDEEGRVRDWWAPGDKDKYNALSKRLIAQSDYEVLPGHRVNGTQTLTENVADLGGVFIAYDAYHMALGGKSPPVRDGLSGDQRFFLAWSQIWQGKAREEYRLLLMSFDTHAPAPVRPFIVRNSDAWVKAFDVKPGDRLWLDPRDRLVIW